MIGRTFDDQILSSGELVQLGPDSDEEDPGMKWNWREGNLFKKETVKEKRKKREKGERHSWRYTR